MDKRIYYKSTSYLGPLFITTPKLGKTEWKGAAWKTSEAIKQ